MANSFLQDECKGMFGSISKKIEAECDNFESVNTLNLIKKKFLDVQRHFPNNVYNEDDSIFSGKSEISADDESEKIKAYLEHSKEDSGYETFKLFDSHENQSSATFDSAIAKYSTNYLYKQEWKLDQDEYTYCAKRLRTSAINETTFYEFGDAESCEETVKNYTDILLAHVTKALMNQEKFTSEIELEISVLVSSAEKSLISEKDQFLRSSEKSHVLLEETFELLSKSQVKKSMSRENGTYLMQKLCDSPVICEKIIAHLIKKVKDHTLHNIECVHELRFSVHLLEIGLHKFRKLGKNLVQKEIEEESYNYYKKNRILALTSENYKKIMENWRKQLEGLPKMNCNQIQSIVNKCIKHV
ncbi:uncharacterized protein LOC117182250 isoform X2 [Belonocnema kinseyi]|uniref:uncharacterized protein LOC117182250 isoform X2 n=1 Tax=Belonocnema kinseyi TaxID=2817044 RepID=UPI00143E0808|nr:uncharacterized protein LOC117182250 isoform X2 [Belonocnema kinseyi]